MRQRSRRADQSGVATTELVIAAPVLFAMLLFIISFGVVYHANHVALAAAEEGARAARARSGSQAAGQARAERFLRDLGGRLIRDPRVSASRTLDTARVEVTGRVDTPLPGLVVRIRQASEGPVERFRGAGG